MTEKWVTEKMMQIAYNESAPRELRVELFTDSAIERDAINQRYNTGFTIKETIDRLIDKGYTEHHNEVGRFFMHQKDHKNIRMRIQGELPIAYAKMAIKYYNQELENDRYTN